MSARRSKWEGVIFSELMGIPISGAASSRIISLHLLGQRRGFLEPALQQSTEQPQETMTIGRRQLRPQQRRPAFAQRRGEPLL